MRLSRASALESWDGSLWFHSCPLMFIIKKRGWPQINLQMLGNACNRQVDGLCSWIVGPQHWSQNRPALAPPWELPYNTIGSHFSWAGAGACKCVIVICCPHIDSSSWLFLLNLFALSPSRSGCIAITRPVYMGGWVDGRRQSSSMQKPFGIQPSEIRLALECKSLTIANFKGGLMRLIFLFLLLFYTINITTLAIY